jgi:hypothetical protein
MSVHDPDMHPFRIDVADPALDDLRVRLERTRFATPTPGPPGQAGISPEYLRKLVDYWLRRFDWRQVEARINAFPQFTADVGGVRMHFVYRRSPRSGAPTVVVLHGWPYTFVEMLPLAAALPEADVVVPSLPGFGFSTIPDGYVATSQAIADTVHRLVSEELGVERYLVYGEDVGAPVSQWLAATRPESVRGIHDTPRRLRPP